MPVQLGSRHEHGFAEPLGLLNDCHRRIERFLDILHRIAEQGSGRELTDEQRRAVEAALEYFRHAAPRHTADEEQSLFPLLRASNDPGAQSVMKTMEALEHDHAAADVAHAAIDSAYRQWLENRSLPPEQAEKLRETLRDLREMYRRHIAVEDQEVFPTAGRLLSQAQLKELGQQMADRRGLGHMAPR